MYDRCRCVVVQAGVARRSSGVIDTLLFVLIRALYCASLQYVSCPTRRRADEPKRFYLENHGYVINVNTIFIL